MILNKIQEYSGFLVWLLDPVCKIAFGQFYTSTVPKYIKTSLSVGSF